MTQAQMIEMIGYLGSALVLVSFLMVSVVRLRLVNTVGSAIFTLYALCIHSYPTAVMNLCLVVINLRFIWKMTHSKAQYDLIRVAPNEALLQHFLAYYKADILQCFPGNPTDFHRADKGYVVCHKNIPVGIMLGTVEDGVFDLVLDYAAPEYRDFSVGQFLVSKLPEDGIRKMIYRGNAENHKAYLLRLGFVETDNAYEKLL